MTFLKALLKRIIAIIATLTILQITILPIVNVVTATNRDIVIVLDPGHGGKMSGAINEEKGLIERDLTLKIARYLRDYLEQYDNIKIIMTHDGLPSDVEMELPDRGMVARNNSADMLISLHLNSSNDSSINGAEVFVTNNKLLPKYHEESAKFGNIVLKNLSALGIKNNGVKTRLCNDTGPKWEYSDGSRADYYAVIRYPMKGDGEDRGADLAKGEGIPGILIEHCYIIGEDAKYLDSEEDLQKLAKADADALVEYYGLEKKDPSRVSSISLDKTNVTLLNGEKIKLNYTITPTTAKNKKVKWTSSNENVAKVSDTGEVTAIGAGKATITATTEDRNKIASATITVQEINISLSKTKVNMLVENKVAIEATVTPNNLTDKKITWKSSDTGVATVDANGIVTAVKEGKATITATLNTGVKTASVEVNIHKLEENQKFKVNNLKQENEILSKIKEKTTVSNFKKNFEISSNLEIVVKNNKNEILKDTDFVGTTTRVEIIQKEDKKVLQEYECLIYGDVNRDGKISAMDYTIIQNHIMEIQLINNQKQKLAADVYYDNKISAMDYTYIQNHIMDIQKIPLR